MPSDSITEIVTVRCPGPAQDDQRCTHGSTTSHGSSANGDWCYGPRRGPSVVTPPAQNEQRRNYCGHESTHAPHLNCCGYQVEFPFPAAPSVSTDHTDELVQALEAALLQADREWWMRPSHPKGSEKREHALALAALAVIEAGRG